MANLNKKKFRSEFLHTLSDRGFIHQTSNDDDADHYFHNENDTCTGIKKWLEKSNTCPICRTEFPKENLTETINEDIEEEERIIRDMDNRVQFMLNSMLNQRIRIMNPQEIIEMEEQRQLDAAIQASLEDQ